MEYGLDEVKEFLSVYRRIGRSEEVLESWRQTGAPGGVFESELLNANAAYVLKAISDYLSLPAELRTGPAIQIDGLESLLGAALKPAETQSTGNVTPAPDNSSSEESDDSIPF